MRRSQATVLHKLGDGRAASVRDVEKENSNTDADQGRVYGDAPHVCKNITIHPSDFLCIEQFATRARADFYEDKRQLVAREGYGRIVGYTGCILRHIPYEVFT